jgi:hypothetical protein
MKQMIKKEFDAVAESRKWREKTGELLAPMTPEERVAFLNRRITDFPKTRDKAGEVSFPLP